METITWEPVYEYLYLSAEQMVPREALFCNEECRRATVRRYNHCGSCNRTIFRQLQLDRKGRAQVCKTCYTWSIVEKGQRVFIDARSDAQCAFPGGSVPWSSQHLFSFERHPEFTAFGKSDARAIAKLRGVVNDVRYRFLIVQREGAASQPNFVLFFKPRAFHRAAQRAAFAFMCCVWRHRRDRTNVLFDFPMDLVRVYVVPALCESYMDPLWANAERQWKRSRDITV